MYKAKLFIIMLAVLGVLFTSNIKVLAEQKIGLVDMAKIFNNYDKAMNARDNLKANQKEIQKMITNAQEELKKLESDKAKKEMEKKFVAKIVKKDKAFKQNFSKKWKKIQHNILTTIKKVADKQGFTLVVDKQSVIAGGEDITEQILAALKK